MSKGRILVVDDESFFRDLYAEVLEDEGFDVETASTGREALSIIESGSFDLVITDFVMPDIDGLEVLERTKQQNALTDVIVVTGHGTIESAIAALKGGAFDYIRKPVNHDELVLTVKRCMEQKRLLEENKEMRQSIKLSELSRTLVATLDINRLYTLIPDSLLQIVPAEAGICILRKKDGDGFCVKGVTHMDRETAEEIVRAVGPKIEGLLSTAGHIKMVHSGDLLKNCSTALQRFRTLFVAPLRKGGECAGYILILSCIDTGRFSPRDIKDAGFLAEQASLAFENALKYEAAKALEYVDTLTDLYNPRYLDTVLEKELKRADRLKFPVTVLFMDIDDFKKVNDTYGHLVGSKVLVEVGRLVVKCVREIDTVVRYGGDEYTVVLVDADTEAAFHVADRIRNMIEEHRFLEREGRNVRITVSIGLATYPVHAKGKKELLEIADRAMYRGKCSTKNVVYIAPSTGSGS